jgi:hypothetical protein
MDIVLSKKRNRSVGKGLSALNGYQIRKRQLFKRVKLGGFKKGLRGAEEELALY